MTKMKYLNWIFESMKKWELRYHQSKSAVRMPIGPAYAYTRNNIITNDYCMVVV